MITGSAELLNLSETTLKQLKKYADLNYHRPVWNLKGDLWNLIDHYVETQHQNLKAILDLGENYGYQTIHIARVMLEGASQLRLLRSQKSRKDRSDLAAKWITFKPPAGKVAYWHGSRPKKLIEEIIIRTEFIKSTGLPASTFLDYYAYMSNQAHWNPLGAVDKRGAFEIAITFGFICLRYAIQCANEFFHLDLDESLKKFD